MQSLRSEKRIGTVALTSLMTLVLGGSLHARAQAAPPETKTFPLKYADQQNDANELLTGLRLMNDPAVKLYLLPSQNVVVVKGTPDQVAEAGRLIEQLDKPHRSFRLAFTLDELEGKTHVATTHFDVTVAPNQRTTLKNGSKIPVVTGSYDAGGSTGVQTQFTYLDVGTSFDVTLTTAKDEFMLKSSVEQSSVAEAKSGKLEQDPVVRQTKLEGVTVLTLAKPVRLGSLDLPGTTRHAEISVTLEEIR